MLEECELFVMTRSKDISPDCESHFSMENGNDSHTLIVQTLPPRPGERDMYMRKSSASNELSGLLYLPYQYLSAVNVSISYRCERVAGLGSPRDGERGREGGKRR